jgi:EcsC protein family
MSSLSSCGCDAGSTIGLERHNNPLSTSIADAEGTMLPPLPPQAMAELAAAREALERKSLTTRLAALAGRPIESLKERLPPPAQDALNETIRRALSVALGLALRSRPTRGSRYLSTAWLQRGLAVASGLAGGSFGLPGTLVELPVSTTLLLRQIAAEAVAAGEDPRAPETAVECIKVFALGNPGQTDNASETGYFATRLALAQFLPKLGARMLPSFLGAVAAPETRARLL